MISEFTRYVDNAAAIAESGRWSAMNERIKRLATKPGLNNEWYVQLFGSLCFQIFNEYTLATSSFTEKRSGDATLLAWRARNLLELSVWCKFFTLSRDHAGRIYEDAGRDSFDIISASEEWGVKTDQPGEWIERLSDGKQDLVQRAAAEGIDPLDRIFKQVASAAKECGIENHFKLGFKMLSRFAHPTAMQILGAADEATTNLQRSIFFGQGCNYFNIAFATLENHQF
jgi:hypothetical protein